MYKEKRIQFTLITPLIQLHSTYSGEALEIKINFGNISPRIATARNGLEQLHINTA